jgi:hypothetical protein
LWVNTTLPITRPEKLVSISADIKSRDVLMLGLILDCLAESKQKIFLIDGDLDHFANLRTSGFSILP